MDEYRNIAKRFNTVSIGDILADFSREDGNAVFRDNQKVALAGVIESVKTKPTRNNSLMAYLALDDGSGGMELLAFQKALDDSSVYMQADATVLVYGRLSARDEKAPQVVVDMLRPLADALSPVMQNPAQPNPAQPGSAQPNPAQSDHVKDKALYVKLSSKDSPEYERLKLVHTMFPGRERMIIHFEDTKVSLGAKCVIHDAFVKELVEMLGEKNVRIR